MLEEVQNQDEGVSQLRRVLGGLSTLPLLIVGEQGTGRFFSVLSMTKELVGEDAQIYQLEQDVHPDFKVVRTEGGREIKVAAIRDMLGDASVQPSRSKWRILVIDGVDKMTAAAANALLKVLEEPPEKVRFFLLAEDLEQVIPTIRSRCALVRYRRLPEDFIVEKLTPLTDDPVKALVYARIADGSIGRAVKYLGSGQLVLRDAMVNILRLGQKGDIAGAFTAVDNLSDLSLGVRFLDQILHDLAIVSKAPACIINVDLLETFKTLRSDLGAQRVAMLVASIRLIHHRASGPITLPFHIKTLIASAFI